jgi:cell division protein FtsI/penicillin-binding protein 2
MGHVGARRPILAGVVALLALGGLAACGNDREAAARRSLAGFLADWRSGHLERASYAGAGGSGVAAAYRKLAGDLADQHPTLTAGTVRVAGDKATAPVTVGWRFGAHTWQYRTTVHLAAAGDRWQVQWSAQTLQPKLTAGRHLQLSDTQAERASIMDGSRKPLVTNQPVVDVGVEPDKVKDAKALAAALGAALHIDLSALPGQLKSAAPTAFVDVITLRRADYEKIRSKIHDLPGTVFREGSLPLAPTRTFARALLGTVGPVTKDLMDAQPGRYRVGDQAGLSGLQRQYDGRLAGSPGVTVQIAGGASPVTVYHAQPAAGQPVATTLDPKVQEAADAALATQTKHATALVAIRISDGAVLAVSNGPDGGSDNLALTASVPPGSTFKVVSTLAYLRLGVTPDTTVNCPQTATVDGRAFHNENKFVLGKVPFHTDFAQSCNTAFAGLSAKLGSDTLTEQAKKLGVGANWKLGVDVDTGSVPAAKSAVDRAAAAFGQGRTTVSPIVMAAISAAVARGHWTQPKLVTQPSPGKPVADGPTLPASDVADLKSMMREVVTSGTATVLAHAPGGPVYGKTGTAEYGSGAEPPSHSWFTGWQGDIAFACFVEDGGTNEQAVAAPLVAKFLTNLNG